MENLAELTREAHKGVWFRADSDDFTRIWFATPFTRKRDADALEESNWQVVTRDLEKRFPEGVSVHSFGHFAHGHYERLYVSTDDAVAIRAVQEWVGRLEEYAVADEMHYSGVEWERNHPEEGTCYSDDPDCCKVVRKWWEFTRDDFSSGAEKRHERAQERHRKATEEWAEAGQLSLFSTVPTVDELLNLMGLEN
ncbi:hypothetical protein ACIOJE_07810 [Kitasatospora sp. NPDC087861]|uniref:hypothetical protein n=1 Tax=Kitasatospora sp. NPDC087861 TaxID=3364070 RepID=UPI0037F14018